jgi:hypothetical protein
MSQHWFVRVAAAVADFSHPFYAEERQRDVWNEGSTFALTVLTWGLLLVGSVAVWTGDEAVLPYAVAMYLLVGVGGWLTICYARCRGVTVDLSDIDLRRPSSLVSVVLVLVYLGGLVGAVRRIAPDGGRFGEGFGEGFEIGVVIGILLWVALIAWATVRRSRAERRAEEVHPRS